MFISDLDDTLKQRITMLSFADYQQFAAQTNKYPHDRYELAMLGLELASEAGEAAGKVKKLYRDGTIDPEALAKELGDVLWAVAVIARELDIPLEAIARMNLEKLASRQERGVISGNGDER